MNLASLAFPFPYLRRAALMLAALILSISWSSRAVADEPNVPAKTYLKMDLYDPGLTLVDADGAGRAAGRVTGQMPDGWDDASSWANVQVHYQLNEDDGQKYLTVQVPQIVQGYMMMSHPLEDYGDHSLFKLTIKARSAQRVPVEFGIRRKDAPWTFIWSQQMELQDGWQTYEYLFELDKNPQTVTFNFEVKSPGTADVASITLDRVSKDQLVADLQARYPDGGPRNLLRTTRLPLGLQSGWATSVVGYGDQNIGQDFNPLVETDPQVVGFSGFPALHIRTGGTLQVYGEPFSVVVPLQPHTASFYVKGTGQGKMIVMRDGIERGAASVAFTASPDWQRVELAFDPKLGAKFYNMRFTVKGEVWIDAFQAGPSEADGQAAPYQTQYPAEIALACVAKDTVEAKVQFTDEPARIEYAVTTDAAPDAAAKFKLRARAINLYGETSDLAPIALEAKKLSRGHSTSPSRRNIPSDRPASRRGSRTKPASR